MTQMSTGSMLNHANLFLLRQDLAKVDQTPSNKTRKHVTLPIITTQISTSRPGEVKWAEGLVL